MSRPTHCQTYRYRKSPRHGTAELDPADGPGFPVEPKPYQHTTCQARNSGFFPETKNEFGILPDRFDEFDIVWFRLR